MDIKLSRFCTPKGSNQAPAYTSYFVGTPTILQETIALDASAHRRKGKFFHFCAPQSESGPYPHRCGKALPDWILAMHVSRYPDGNTQQSSTRSRNQRETEFGARSRLRQKSNKTE